MHLLFLKHTKWIHRCTGWLIFIILTLYHPVYKLKNLKSSRFLFSVVIQDKTSSRYTAPSLCMDVAAELQIFHIITITKRHSVRINYLQFFTTQILYSTNNVVVSFQHNTYLYKWSLPIILVLRIFPFFRIGLQILIQLSGCNPELLVQTLILATFNYSRARK